MTDFLGSQRFGEIDIKRFNVELEKHNKACTNGFDNIIQKCMESVNILDEQVKEANNTIKKYKNNILKSLENNVTITMYSNKIIYGGLIMVVFLCGFLLHQLKAVNNDLNWLQNKQITIEKALYLDDGHSVHYDSQSGWGSENKE